MRVISSETTSLEEIYKLPTVGREITDISDEEFKKLGLNSILDLKKIEGIADFYSEEAIEKIKSGFIPSFGPIVWLTSVMLAIETVKVLLKWGDIAAGPEFSLYDPFCRRIPKVGMTK